MRSLIFLTAIITAATAMSIKMAPLLAENSEVAIEGRYIVVFLTNVSDDTVRAHHAAIAQEMMYFEKEENEVRHTYHVGSFRGYSAKLNDKLRDRIRLMPEVKYVERAQKVELSDAEAFKPFCLEDHRDLTWGLARTSQRFKYSLEDPYVFDEECTGEGVDVYVIDTGTDNTLSNFEGRARFGADCVGSSGSNCNGNVDNDGNGHGTHVTGTVISVVYGLARGATAISVRVLNSGGSGSYEDVIAGVLWVPNNRDRARPSIINMSLGGPVSTGLNDAVEAAKRAGVHVVVAAGNEFANACSRSPAGAGIITVGATDIDDVFAYFSNYGSCVDILGPGVSIVAEKPGGGTNTYSGTSMASPHVAGVLAKYLTNSNCRDGTNDDPESMEAYLARTATSGAISGVPADTVNLLVHMGCEPGQK